MKTYSHEEIKAVLDAHWRWLKGEEGGARADLSGANLSRADLPRANLYGANLSRADLSRADLYGADLYGADLSRANLYRADLSRADLYGANLYGANLSGANLSRADLSRANLYRADLSRADLYGADLYGADLYGADLSGAKNADLVAAITVVACEGSLIGWKKCRAGVIVKLRIPEKAKRSNSTGRKCRAEFADVLEVIGAEVGISLHDGATEYRAGSRVTCDHWNEDRWIECGGGIHFYVTRAEAEAHQ